MSIHMTIMNFASIVITNVGIMNELYICYRCINEIKYDKFEYCNNCNNITYCIENPEIEILKNKIKELQLLRKKLSIL